MTAEREYEMTVLAILGTAGVTNAIVTTVVMVGMLRAVTLWRRINHQAAVKIAKDIDAQTAIMSRAANALFRIDEQLEKIAEVAMATETQVDSDEMASGGGAEDVE